MFCQVKIAFRACVGRGYSINERMEVGINTTLGRREDAQRINCFLSSKFQESGVRKYKHQAELSNSSIKYYFLSNTSFHNEEQVKLGGSVDIWDSKRMLGFYPYYTFE